MPPSILDQVRLLIPPLTAALHKGQSGRIAIVGGSQEYTGAPYFAGISALRMGADLSHVICAPSAAPAIKGYSPDLIVHPLLSAESSTADVRPAMQSLLQRLHVLVIGPGLGRSTHMQAFAKLSLLLARERGLYVVLDADALWMVQHDPDIIKGYRRAVLTPNYVEFKRLCEAMKIPVNSPPSNLGTELSAALGGVTILQKGSVDVVAFSHSSPSSVEREKAEVVTKGGLKRCGGQGDILSGAVATMLAWGKNYEEGAFGNPNDNITEARIPLLASVGAAIVTRTASRRAFEKHGRSVVTNDMIPEIGPSFNEVFDHQHDDEAKFSRKSSNTYDDRGRRVPSTL